MKHDISTLQKVTEQFAIEGAFLKAEPYGTGHINDTYLVLLNTPFQNYDKYILQRINHNIFKNPPQLMENIVAITSHLQSKLKARKGAEPDREALTVIPTKDGKNFYYDKNGNYWRMYIFIRDTISVDVCSKPEEAYNAAKAFGKFQAELADFDGKKLNETIPFFHHTPRRFSTLEEAIEKDAFNRAKTCKNEIDFCLERKPLTSAITSLLETGAIPQRVTHNDTKVNNVLMDKRTGAGICVIDLDTVMPGSILYDFGDMVRTTTRFCAEDERDLSKVKVELHMFEALTKGYLETAASFLTPLEAKNLVVAGKLITFTIGIRFLSDYLSGDTYFKIHRENHNLERARVQFKMMESIEQNEEKMEKIVQRYL